MILRVKRKSNYTILSNTVLHDASLSMKAKGLHSYIMSLPDDWTLYQKELEDHFTDGRVSISTAMNELLNAGYVKRRQMRTDSGRVSGYDYTVYDELVGVDSPDAENPRTENPHTENRPLLSTDTIPSTNDNNNLSPPSADGSAEDNSSRPETDQSGVAPQPPAKSSSKRFVKPLVSDVDSYMMEIQDGKGIRVDAQVTAAQACKFHDRQESIGWKVGRAPMKNWKAAVRTWVGNDYDRVFTKSTTGKSMQI